MSIVLRELDGHLIGGEGDDEGARAVVAVEEAVLPILISLEHRHGPHAVLNALISLYLNSLAHACTPESGRGTVALLPEMFEATLLAQTPVSTRQ